MTALEQMPIAPDAMQYKMNTIFEALQNDAFRARFKLREREISQLQNKSMDVILLEGARFINKRLAPLNPVNDGAQTPMKGHPIFVAQHATGTCCRGCLMQWHNISADHALTPTERQYILQVLTHWLALQGIDYDPIQGVLF